MADSPNDYRDPKVTTSGSGGGSGVGKWIAIAIAVLLALALLAWLLGWFNDDADVTVVPADQGTVVVPAD